MALSTYDVGDKVRLTANFTDTGGTAADPTLVTFIHRDPSGNESTMISSSTTVKHPSVGKFYIDLTIDEAGTWRWRSYSTGNIVTASEAAFVVRKQYVGL